MFGIWQSGLYWWIVKQQRNGRWRKWGEPFGGKDESAQSMAQSAARVECLHSGLTYVGVVSLQPIRGRTTYVQVPA